MSFLYLFEPISGVTEFFDNNPVARIIIDAYLALFLISLVVFLAIKFKKALILTIIGLLMLAFYYLAVMGGFTLSKRLYEIALTSYVIICVVILAPELRKMMEFHRTNEATKTSITSTQATIEAVADAVFDMSAVKVGALITIEQHVSLEQYSERAITLNSDISKELLEQIFIKDSPLHDGGVIIRGNKIICAAAYYTLTQDTSLDKTVGSRHRAGVGISEITDSLTIIVSEETGHVHVANQGFMKQIDNKNDLLDYLNTYLGNL